MSRRRSLKWDLIVDLSLITLCALLLAEGLMISVLRVKLPADFAQVASSYLTATGQSFSISEEYKQSQSTDLQDAFNQFVGSPSVGLQLVNSPAAFQDSKVREVRSKIFLFFPYVSSYEKTVSLPRGETVVVRWSLDNLQASLTEFKYQIFLLTLLIEVVLVILAYYLLFRRNIMIPIVSLGSVARDFLSENWSSRCALERNDELGQIGEALNEMAYKIQEKERKLVMTIDSLKAVNEELEARQHEQLQIEKLASIGRLAAGVAHEVGNPLGAISGYVDILRRSMKKQSNIVPEDVELLDRIESETNRISKIIRALLQQARPTKDRIRPVTLKPVLVRSVSLAQIPSHIDVEYDFEDENAVVMAEEDQLVQIFLNLLVNAKHAIEARKDRPERGMLRIRCKLRKLPVYRNPGSQGEGSGDLDTSIVRALKPESYWVTSVEDNGIGINEEDQKKLFEPFFSTKAPGKGTGLGLYVTKSIVESFRGAIVLRSAFGYGAAFSVFLPKARA